MIFFYVVGTDIEIKLNPRNHEEHIKESMSEENCIAESPLKNVQSSRTIKVL